VTISLASSNTIGGTAAGARNVISGNNQFGIQIANVGATGNLVRGNLIGTKSDGLGALGNSNHGIALTSSASNNTVGGAAAGAGNTIAFNGADGVFLDSTAGAGNAIGPNSIHDNTGLGIDLGSDGIALNDGGDPDIGPNNLQNFPVLNSATASGGSTTVQGSLNSTPSTSFTIEFFSNPACDSSGNGEGAVSLGSHTASTDGSGDVSYIKSGLFATTVGHVVTATATRNSAPLDTSEFSACRIVELDTDGDGWLDTGDNCPLASNAGQEDGDGDTVGNVCDNCPSASNAGQENADGDALGDACDSDDDGDLVTDDAETACGSDPMDVTPPLSRPERVDGAFAGVDDDGDTAVDEALPGGAANFDCDGDGYTGAAEGGTALCGNGMNDDDKVGVALVPDDAVIDDGCPGGPAQAGAFSEAQFNIGGSDQDPCGLASWPSDFFTGGFPDSTNKINITDLTSFIAPPELRRLDSAPGQPTFDKRWDLSPGRGVFNNMINVTDLTSLIAGSSGFPPMLGGVKAFNGPACPWGP
jgi:hypothetical protein